jgi:pimeloyl-ACP methyl ester carboxylesterase
MAETFLRRYPLATLEVLRNAGHYPMNETPLALAAAIESFLVNMIGVVDADLSVAL